MRAISAKLDELTVCCAGRKLKVNSEGNQQKHMRGTIEQASRKRRTCVMTRRIT